tara:strand:+ start:325 stop:828 length:504 start_codon:yes stop_codon:yes gene_type:complete
MLQIFIALTAIPIVELYLIFALHDYLSLKIGSGNAVLTSLSTIFITGVIGAKLLRLQGFQVVSKIQRAAAQGETPACSLVEGVIILIGGILLLTPGYLTDIVGFFFMVEPCRAKLAQLLVSRFNFEYAVSSNGYGQRYQDKGQPTRDNRKDDTDIIDITATTTEKKK